ncbi:MAG TPA: polysaccharide biosynthesis/export family protein [Gemmatimonadaceae bacterium]|nr:polysaccharide biosynthesis/export family protein [Gemmatimonadaceae bacterium]
MKKFLLTLILAAANTAAAQSTNGSEGLNPGDQLRIAVWRNPELSGDFTIAANGTITHPLYREVQVTGLPLSTVEERLRTFLSRYTTNPQFVIQPLVRISVSGEVRSPQILSVPPETSVSQAVILAGGPNPNAKLDNVRLLRAGQEIVVNLASADAQAASLQIRSGDRIVVPGRSNTFRDFVSPAISVIGAAAAITSIFLK